MKNILLVTPLYPIPSKDNNTTGVCHFFTREWVKSGFNVIVIHVQPVHCRMWHLLVRLFGKQLKNRAGGGNYYAMRLQHTEAYKMADVQIYRIPTYNFIPRGITPEKSIRNLIKQIVDILSVQKFTPDIIVGHMLGLNIIPQINEFYHSKTCMVSHGEFGKYDLRYPDYKKLIESYDIWGFRSRAIQEQFESKYGKVSNSFICYSGIPQELVAIDVSKSHNSFSNFVFVGELIERKNPLAVLESLYRSFGKEGFHLTYIGEGPEKDKIIERAKCLGVEDNLVFTGKIPRNQISRYLDNVDCFIMISRGEAFGLVYLEAMARGCIAIGSFNEGIDGIIKNRNNGFLCSAGNIDELSSLLIDIAKMDPSKRREIAMRGYYTAANMTDKIAAKDYINALIQLYDR